MTRARAFLAFLAVYFLARATGAHASDFAGPTDLPDNGDAGILTQQDRPPDLASVPVELGQIATPVSAEPMLAGDRSGPAAASETGAAALDIAAEAASASTAANEASKAGSEQAGLELPAPPFGGQSDAVPISSAPRVDDAPLASAGARPVSDEELSEQRGGFVYQGVDIRLGVEIRSYVGDELVMQTNFNWTDAQANVERTVSTELAPAALASVQAGMLNGAGLSMRVGDDNVYVTNQGQTAFIQRADGSLQNIILNSASNVALRQQIDANLDISNFAPFQNDIVSSRIVSALSDMATTALSMGTAR